MKTLRRQQTLSSLLHQLSRTADRSIRHSEETTMEMKTILKPEKKVGVLLEVKDALVGQSDSVGVVRWTLPEESHQAHSSAPVRYNKRSQHPRQNGLKDLRSLQECVQFIQNWKEQVDRVCKQGSWDPEEGSSKTEHQSSDHHAERSLQESRKLILRWADELHHVHKKLTSESQGDENKLAANEEAQLRIMGWAKELQETTESCGVRSEELGKALRLLGPQKKNLVKLLPLLEFITWTLLDGDSTKTIPQLWLLAKQKRGKAGTPRYIPNSVWSWICSAAADVILDPKTNYPWLLISEDQRRVQEGLSAADLPYNSQRFDSWPCVVGWQGYSSGRHYWEVDLSNNGCWRIGVTAADSQRHGRFPMTPKQGFWALWRSTKHFYACTKPETPLPVSLVPRRIGIYLDYEEGQISFYNAQDKSHIYTFTGNFEGKLYPLFAPMDGRTLITIIDPHKISVN
ncbi:E3 ubiquitin-protein ligase TRIM39 isoform X2 [Mugil cephalus]|uniref:E3 ubiquitin-protein ligase TRIM39 isoform X2 n=1 Tax=Mugil cephalus TaxID=48193 RepID=UPI001FB658C3|nr:E3 ubiquitin-protein ligase TRIM39 isoform X2 [Mugil cephalus]